MLRVATALLLAATLGCANGGTPPPVTRPTPTPTATPSPSPARTAPPLPRSMAALGDSMTRAFLACASIGDCPDASWATGTLADVDSHQRRIAAAAGRAVRADNLAVSGARVGGLPGQVERAVEAKPEYVTVLIGANDACAPSEASMTPADEYARAFDRALATLARGLPRTRVLVVSIPSLLRLWEVGRTDAGARTVWERYPICRSMLGDATDTSAAANARRERVDRRVRAYNAAMARSCAKHRLCRWDGDAVYRYAFTLAEVSSRDYWHPDREGQRSLAEVTWRAGFWGGA